MALLVANPGPKDRRAAMRDPRQRADPSSHTGPQRRPSSIPFDPEAAALFFALISSRNERRSLIVSGNKTFSAWAEIFGDPVAVATMVDRLVHQAEVIVLTGESYRLRGKREEVLTGEKQR
jgi:hypothetical protein